MLCIAQQNLSIGVNVVSEGSPSRMRRVRRISFGITILPKSSDLLTIPVAVPDIFVGFQKPSSSVDRGHSLRSLLPPPAALPSLPSCFHISFSFLQTFCRGEHCSSACWTSYCGNGRPMAAPTIFLQITLFVSVN